jgi:hypothetical protein
MIKAGLASSHL